MGIFDNLKKKNGEVDDYVIFTQWLNKVLQQEHPKGIIAFNFNLNEGSDKTYHIQLIGSDEFDKDDSDWACTDYFTTGEDICRIKRTKDIDHWEDGLKYITKMVQQYLDEGGYKSILKSATAVGIGFVDGDIEIIYHAQQ